MKKVREQIQTWIDEFIRTKFGFVLFNSITAALLILAGLAISSLDPAISSGDNYMTFLLLISGVSVSLLPLVRSKVYFNFVLFVTITSFLTRVTFVVQDFVFHDMVLANALFGASIWMLVAMLWSSFYSLEMYPNFLHFHKLDADPETKIFIPNIKAIAKKKKPITQLQELDIFHDHDFNLESTLKVVPKQSEEQQLKLFGLHGEYIED